MTTVLEPVERDVRDAGAEETGTTDAVDEVDEIDDVQSSTALAPGGPEAARLGTGVLVALWTVIGLFVLAVVLYAIEPMFQQREQGLLLAQYRSTIDRAANQATGLQGVEAPTTAPSFGSPVGIVEIGPLGLQVVVVEGADAGTTMVGPGHVPGTAAPGQPGNSVIVGRRAMFGGPFGGLGSVVVGDEIVVSTTQGQTLYQVTDLAAVALTAAAGPVEAPEVPAPTTTTTTTTAPTTTVPAEESAPTTVATDAPPLAEAEPVTVTAEPTTTLAPVESSLAGGSIPLTSLYGTSTDDRLTLVSSASAFPWNSGEAEVVIAVMVGKPFAPTPQNGRSAGQTGTAGDAGQWPVTLLAFLFLGAAVAGAVVLYRRSSPRVAYLLTVPPLLAFAILASESFSLLLPAWT